MNERISAPARKDETQAAQKDYSAFERHSGITKFSQSDCTLHHDPFRVHAEDGTLLLDCWACWYDARRRISQPAEPQDEPIETVELFGREMSKDAYAALVNAGSGLLLFLVGCACAVAFRYTNIPYFLFFAGWLMRSGWTKASITFKWRES